MEKISVGGDVALYIEQDRQLATFHNLKNNDRAYINSDMVDIVQHLLSGLPLESFFPLEIQKDKRDFLITQSKIVLDNLVERDFLSTGDKIYRCGVVKQVKTNPPLRVVFIELTRQCNLSCGHCYASCGSVVSGMHIGRESIFDLLSQLDDAGVMELQLTGGEPFILPYFLDIIIEAQKRLIPCSIFTNGTLMSERIFRYISENNYGLIFYISLDGHQQTHDLIRNKQGAFNKTIETVNRLLSIGCDVRINTAIGRNNIGEMKSFMPFVKEEFGVLHRLVTVEPIGRADVNMTISPKEFSALFDLGCSLPDFLDSHDCMSDWTTPACGVGSSMLFIDYAGNVSFCPTLTGRENAQFLAGNIHRNSITDIWECSDVFTQHRGFQCRDIEKCSFKEVCKGGCRSRAFLSTGKVDSPDLAMCALYNQL